MKNRLRAKMPAPILAIAHLKTRTSALGLETDRVVLELGVLQSHNFRWSMIQA